MASLRRSTLLRSPSLCGFLLWACAQVGESAEGGGDPLPDRAAVTLAGPCDQAENYGGIAVAEDGSSSEVGGKVANGVVPIAVLETIESEGGCTVLRQGNPYCNPACGPAEACDFEGRCVEYPLNQDLGTVTLTGLVVDVTMEVTFPGNFYFASDVPNPAIAPGGVVRLSMPEGAYGPAELYGVGVEPLVPTGGAWTITEGHPLDLSWAPPGLPAPRSEIVLALSIDLHGVSPGTLRCVFADTGAASVPAGAITALVGAGVTGFPSGTLERRTADHAAAGAGCFDFTVRSARRVEVEVSGHMPCVSDADCTDPQRCNEELQTCS